MILVLSSRILAMPAALIGGALLALVILRLGRRSFSPRLFGVAIACGAIVAFLPAALGFFEARLHLALPPFWEAVFKAFVLAGFNEEGAKLAAGYFLVRTYYERRTARDLILGVAAVALGFALLENALYVFAAADRWPAIALARMATAVPIHALIGLVLGSGLARADAEPGGAARVFLILRAWLIAAVLHGFYDLPLFLGQRAPLYPTQLNQFALAFSATTPTLIAILYLAAVVAISIGAVRVVLRLRRETGVESASSAARAIWPNWLDRLVFAQATGFVLGAVLLLPASVWVAMAVNATIAGVMPVMTLDALSVCAASALVGSVLLLRATPPAAAAPAADPPRVLRKSRVVAFGAVAAIGIAIFVFSGAIDAARRSLLAYALLISGNSYSALGDLEHGIGNYDAALVYKPDFAAALFQRAMANKTYQRYDRTLEDLNSAARFAPDDPAILSERANVFENLHQSEKAIADLDRALKIKPDEPALLSMRAEILTNEGEFDKAAADLDRALQLKPDVALAHAGRGDLFLQKYDYSNALRELDEAIRLEPNIAGPYFTRGRVHYFRDELPAAITDLQQASGRQRDAYSALWLYLARGRAGQNGRDELMFWASLLSHSAWPFPLIEFYVGARPAPSVYSAAVNADQICEADFYIGEWLVQQRLEQPAIERLRRAAATCPKSFIEHGGAIAELARLTAPAVAPPSTITRLNRLAPPFALAPPAGAPAVAGGAKADSQSSPAPSAAPAPPTPPASAGPNPAEGPANAPDSTGAAQGQAPAPAAPNGQDGAPGSPGAKPAGATLMRSGSMMYEGSASWRKIAPDDSISNPGALALEVDFPQLAIKFFATFEKMRDDNSTAPFALTMRVARTTAPGVKETGFQLTGNIGAPSVMGSGYVGPLRFAGPVVRVIGNTFQASIANADVAFDLAALKEGARLDIPLPAIPGIHNGEEGFDLVIDIGEGAAGDARDLATLWQQPAPAPEAPSNAVETKAAPTQAVPVGSVDEGKAEVPAGGDGEAPGRAPPPPASAGNGDASAASPPDSKPGDAQEAARVDPDAAAQHYNRGAMQQAQGKFDGAIAEYRVAIGLDAANADAHRDLGAMLKQQGMLEDAAVELREAIRLKPDGAQAHQFLGEVRLEQQAFDAAVAEYREAIRLAPNEAAPHRLLGAAMIEIARGKAGDQQVARLQEACDELARGAALAPSDPNFPILEGIVEASLAQRGHCPP